MMYPQYCLAKCATGSTDIGQTGPSPTADFQGKKKSIRPSITASCRLQTKEFSLFMSALNLVAIGYAVRCHKI